MTSQLQSPFLPAAVAAEQTCLRIPSRPEWIAPTVEFLRDKAVRYGVCHEARAGKLELALHEALTNSVIHGNLELSSDLKEHSENAFAEALAARSADPRYGSRPVDVHVDYDGRRCRWTFTDQGKGFDVERVLARADEAGPDEPLSSGRGILLMRALLDEVRYEAGGRRVVLTLARPPDEEKRHEPRRPIQQPVCVAPIREDGTVDWEAADEAVMQNLSSRGMSLLQARLAASDRILIGLDWEGRMLYVPAEVRHCQGRGGDAVEIGCRFLFSPDAPPESRTATTNTEQAIAALLDQLSNQVLPHDERRSHPRAVYIARIRVQAGPDRQPVIGFARDLSRGGISFLALTPLARETVVLSLPRPDQTALQVAARVVRCNQLMAGIYDVGACFVDLAER